MAYNAISATRVARCPVRWGVHNCAGGVECSSIATPTRARSRFVKSNLIYTIVQSVLFSPLAGAGGIVLSPSNSFSLGLLQNVLLQPEFVRVLRHMHSTGPTLAAARSA